MILSSVQIKNGNVHLKFINEDRKKVTLLRVYDFEKQVLVTRNEIKIEKNGDSVFPVQWITNEFHNGVKYVIDLQDDHVLLCEQKVPLNEIYNIHIYIADNKKITFDLRANDACRVKLVSVDKKDNGLILNIDNPDSLVEASPKAIVIKRRVSNLFWQFHDHIKQINILNKNYFLGIKELIELCKNEDSRYWDLFVRFSFIDGTFYDAPIQQKNFSMKFESENKVIEIFAGNGQTLLMKCQSKDFHYQKFFLEKYTQNENSIKIEVSTSTSTIDKNDIFLVLTSSRSFDEIDLKDRQILRYGVAELSHGNLVFNLPVGEFFTKKFGSISRFISTKTNWQFVIYYRNNIYNLEVPERSLRVDSDYCPINERLDGKIYVKKNRLCMYTHTGVFKEFNKINVAVFGTCFTRNIFRSTQYFNEDYKTWYDCQFTQFHSSTISLVSKPYHQLDSKLEKLNRVEKKFLELDFHKNFLTELIKLKPSYILLDLYCDATIPTINVDGESCISLNLYNRYSSILTGLSYKKIYRQSDWDEYFAVWRNSIRTFLRQLSEVVPLERVIIVQSRFALEYFDMTTGSEPKSFSNKWKILKDNLVWDRLEEFILKEFPNLRTIDMRDCKFLADKQSPLGFSPSHYETKYYIECLHRLNKIVLEDYLSRR